MICILLLYIIFFSISFSPYGLKIVLKLSMLSILCHRDLVPSALVHTWIKATFWKSNYYCGWVALSVIKWILILSIVVVQFCRPMSSSVVQCCQSHYDQIRDNFNIKMDQRHSWIAKGKLVGNNTFFRGEETSRKNIQFSLKMSSIFRLSL